MPKKPDDHKPKKPKIETVDGGRAVTLRGITVTVADDALDDFEMLEDLGKIQHDPKSRALLPSVLRRLVGDDGFDTVMGALRAENGRVPVQAGVEFVSELFQALNPNS